MGWWDFGEHSGFDGNTLALHRITCPFCEEQGNFAIAHRQERKHPATKKVLHYDTLQCGNCGNLTFAFWTVSGYGAHSRGMHDFKTLPWPVRTTSFPEHWPKDVGRYWLQARRSLEGKNWDAAALMARSAVQLVMREQQAKGANLKREIDDIANKGILPPIMKEWSHEVRVLANENAHPSPGDQGTSSQDANDVVEFLGKLLTMTYDLPQQIEEFRGRKKDK